jgi:hypothetical protein
VLGGLFVIVTVAMPKGLVGSVDQIRRLPAAMAQRFKKAADRA